MEHFYQEVIAEIDALIEKQNHREASELLKQELSMPYIPQDVEAALREREALLKGEASQRLIHFDGDALEAMLLGERTQAMIAVDYLKTCNIRMYLELIQDVMPALRDRQIIAALIEALMQQNISEELHCDYEGMEVAFLPCFIDDPFDNDGVEAAASYLSTWFEHDNAAFHQMCMQTLMLESFLRLPFTIEEDEAEVLAAAIAGYVFEAFGQKDEYFAFLKQKNLARFDGYELLLRKHG